MSVNKVILVGNLGQDVDLRHTSDGRAVANISLATTDSWKDKNTGEKMQKTEWHRVVFFGPIASIANQYLSKGSKIYVEGKLQTRKWQDKNGQDRYTTEVLVGGPNATMQMLDSKQDTGSNMSGEQSQNNPMNNQVNDNTEDQFDDDLPF